MTKLNEKNVSSKETLQKRQWTKYISKALALCLMHYNPLSILYKAYKNTSFCNQIIETNEIGKLKTSYCKNRWCGTCLRIKTARFINNYLPQLQELFQPVFVTLTLPTCNGEELKQRIEIMEKTWRTIYNKSKKAKYKKTNNPLKGIKKAECTIRPNSLYHYHFHFILNDWAQGEWLISEWLKHFPEANKKAQDIRFSDEFALREIFKYTLKSEIKINEKNSYKQYDTVFTALRKKQTISAFGGIKAIKEDFEEEDLTNGIVIGELANRIFKWTNDDWYDINSGEALIGISIPEKIKKMTYYPQ